MATWQYAAKWLHRISFEFFWAAEKLEFDCYYKVKKLLDISSKACHAKSGPKIRQGKRITIKKMLSQYLGWSSTPPEN